MNGNPDFISFERDSSDENPIQRQTLSKQGIVKENGPWTKGKTYDQPSIFLRLHEELVDFYNYMHATKEEHQTRIDVIQRYRLLSKKVWPESELYPYGSFITDMYLPASDIDVVILNVNQALDPVNRLAGELNKEGLVSQLETISSAKIPIIKCTDKETGIKVDICFGVTDGLESAKLVQTYLSRWPIMRPLVFFLKYFLQWRQLNDTYQGGVGSFMLQIMVVSMIQLHPIRKLKELVTVDKDITLGAWLLSFFELYGKNFNYIVVGISVKGEGSYYRKEARKRFDISRPYLLSIENPLNEEIDTGRNSFAIMRVRNAFEYAYNQLLLQDDVTNGISLLSRIVGVRDEELKNRGFRGEKISEK